jgi:ATP-dependent Clp protease ATP-binding subunit ClpC
MKYNFIYEESVVHLISKVGFDEVFGARPIKRAIQNKIEDLISEKILTGDVTENKDYMLFVKTEGDSQIIDVVERVISEPKKKSRKKKGE